MAIGYLQALKSVKVGYVDDLLVSLILSLENYYSAAKMKTALKSSETDIIGWEWRKNVNRFNILKWLQLKSD